MSRMCYQIVSARIHPMRPLETNDDPENREGTFSFKNMYLLTISSLPTGYWGDTCSPHTHSEHDKEGSSLPHQHHLLPQKRACARFRGSLFATSSLLPRKRACMLVLEGWFLFTTTTLLPLCHLVMFRLWPEAVSQAKPSQNRPGQARPTRLACEGFWPGL